MQIHRQNTVALLHLRQGAWCKQGAAGGVTREKLAIYSQVGLLSADAGAAIPQLGNAKGD
jgi:hypothetical protein